MAQTILVIDDEADIRDILADIFEDEGYHVLKAAHSEQAFAVIQSNMIDLIVLDIWLDNSDMDGVQILQTLKKKQETKTIPVLMISGHGNVEMAVNAMKQGAFDFIEKPFKIDHILLTVQRALEQKKLYDENIRLKDRDSIIPNSGTLPSYQSPAMSSLIKTICDDKQSDGRVVILGDIGTGKTHIAKIIHDQSPRHHHPCLSVSAHNMNPKDLDAFIKNAGQGTLIIENIERCPKDTQNTLLGHLTSKETSPACRFITTATTNIQDCLKDGALSSALYDRLAIISYDVPPLSKRINDMDDLIAHFTHSICEEFHVAPLALSQDFVDDLKSKQWPGNIRQLKIVVENSVIEILLNDGESQGTQHDKNIVNYPQTDGISRYTDMPLKDAREQFERDYLEKIMTQCSGNIAKMADMIEMERTALYRKLKALGLSYQSNTQNNTKAVS